MANPLIENLCAVDHAFTTIDKNDAFNWSRTHNAIMQGVDELFLTGIGPELELGSVVPLYLTKSDFIPDMYRGGVGRIYFTASPTIENSKAPSARDNRFNNATFLYKCLELKEKIPFAELKDLGIIPHARSVQAFGHTKSKLSNDRKSALWNFIFQNDLASEQRVEELFNATRTLPKVAISYAGEDWIAARRLASWLRHYGVQSFLVTSTGSLGVLEAAVLERLLQDVFQRALVSILLIPRQEVMSKWIELEHQIACASGNHVFIVERDARKNASIAIPQKDTSPGSSLREWRLPLDPDAFIRKERALCREVKKLIR